MKEPCRNFRDRLADAAEGRADAATAAHVAACPSCMKAVERIKLMIDSMRYGWQDAPQGLVDLAKGLMAPSRRRVFARLLGTSLAAGARTVSEDFQVVVGDGDLSVRIMVTRVEEDWQLMGRLPEGEWEVDAEGEVQVSNGRFVVRLANLGRSEMVLRSTDTELVIPPLSTLAENEAQ